MRRMGTVRYLILTNLVFGLVALFWGACSEPVGPAVCPDSVDLSVTAGTAPTFTWQPRCRASALLVTDLNTGALKWGITPPGGSFFSEPMLPPVQYGTLPAGMAGDSALTLSPGVSYFAVLVIEDSSFGSYGRPIGSRVFIP